MKAVCVAVLLALFCLLSFGQNQATAARDISEANTAYVLDRGADLQTMDGIRNKLRSWGRWKLVDRLEDADLLIIVSDREIGAGSISTANGSATASETMQAETRRL